MRRTRSRGANLLLEYAARLRFRTLFFLTAGLFLLDLVLPDAIPFADELLLGLATLLLGTWRKPREEGIAAEAPPSARTTGGLGRTNGGEP